MYTIGIYKHMYTVGQKTDNLYALVGNQLDQLAPSIGITLAYVMIMHMYIASGFEALKVVTNLVTLQLLSPLQEKSVDDTSHPQNV